MQQILSGVLVIDYTQFMSGPFCTMALGDMGAAVIRVEPPGGGGDRGVGPFAPNGQPFLYLMCGRNKKSITLDVRKQRGKELFAALVAKADVVVDNLGPPAKRKLGLSYEELALINPKIIYTDISAFGHEGPRRDGLGMDISTQAMSGMMSVTGFPEGPDTRFPITFIDVSTGLFAAYATVLALMHRLKTGEGQHIQASLFETAMGYMGLQGVLAEYEVLGQIRPKLGNKAYYGYGDSFQAKDGAIVLITPNDGTWQRLINVIGHCELADDPRLATTELRWRNHEVLDKHVQAWIGQRTRDEVWEAFERAGVPSGRVNSVAEALHDPQVEALDLFVTRPIEGVGDLRHPRLPVRMSRTPSEIRHAAPMQGQHNDEIYGGMLGLNRQEIEDLAAQGVI